MNEEIKINKAEIKLKKLEELEQKIEQTTQRIIEKRQRQKDEREKIQQEKKRERDEKIRIKLEKKKEKEECQKLLLEDLRFSPELKSLLKGQALRPDIDNFAMRYNYQWKFKRKDMIDEIMLHTERLTDYIRSSFANGILEEGEYLIKAAENIRSGDHIPVFSKMKVVK
jgi:hypothetical protein